MADDIRFVDQGQPTGTDFDLEVGVSETVNPPDDKPKYPPAILKIDEEVLDKFKTWLDQWLQDLISEQQEPQKRWGEYEEAYRALPEGFKRYPFEGACNEVIPVIAMAVDPIYARLETGMFKQDPVFQIKIFRKDCLEYVDSLNQFVEFYQKHRAQLRKVMSPRILEATKLGTCVVKTVYDQDKSTIKSYDDDWNVVDKELVRFQGPRTFGVSLGDFLFPPRYQYLQQCPIVAERIRTTYDDLKIAEASGKLANVDELTGQETFDETVLEKERAEAVAHKTVNAYQRELVVYEIWCRYDINGDGIPESLVVTYHKDLGIILQLRYNWYFHQRYPYTVIPYSQSNDSLYGIGIAEMSLPFQKALTRWHQMASDNAYIANIRMFIVKKGSGIENAPRLYSGRCFYVDDPKSDFIPFASGDTYPSTLTERQNLFGLVEKRTGVSDYLTGRESPIIGSRATATSTIALIQEGTRRVEQVMENFRYGSAEVVENWFYIWIQYGLDDIEGLAFGNDSVAADVKAFFSKITENNINSIMSLDLTATDAATNKQAMQQMQLQIIQVMMGYYEKLLEAGAQAIQAEQVAPQFTEMVADVMTASNKLFKDLLQRYDIRNPEDYLPDLTQYLAGPAEPPQPGLPGGPQDPLAGLGGPSGIPLPPVPSGRPMVPSPGVPGSGSGGLSPLPMAGGAGGIQ